MAACIHCQWVAAAAGVALDGEAPSDRVKGAAWLKSLLDRELTMDVVAGYFERSRSR